MHSASGAYWNNEKDGSTFSDPSLMWITLQVARHVLEAKFFPQHFWTCVIAGVLALKEG